MVPYLRVANVYDGVIDYSDVNQMHFSVTDQQKYTLRKGDILLNEGQSTELVGRSAIYDGPDDRYCYQNSLVNFRCGPQVIPAFARAIFKRWLDIGHFTTIVKQTTSMAHLGGARFANLEFPVPPLPEQRQIASVLATLDNAIGKTEQIVAKLKHVRHGLVHDLLTRGIDDNGEVRDPERRPEQFKESPVGRIPREWDVRTLRDVVRGGLSNGVFKEPARVGVGCPLVNVGDLYSDFGIDVRRVERFRAFAAETARFAVAPGDLFFTRSSLNLAGIAWCNIVREVPEPSVFECHLMRAKPDARVVVPAFLGFWCRAPFARAFMMARAKQVTMTTIAQPDLLPLPVPIPVLAEQDRIVEAIDGVQARLEREVRYLYKLRSGKRGLSEDLLTGRVRIQVAP